MSQLTWGLMAAGVAGALIYGLFFLQRPPSALRTLSKIMLAAGLSLAARFADAPGFLALAFALCAVGDACMAGDPKRWLSPGIAVFLLGHLLLVVLFVEIGEPRLLLEPLRAAGAAAAVAWSGWLLFVLWPKLGALKPAGAAYALALLATVVSALTLGTNFAWAILGAVLFLASDSILALRLFRYEGAPHRLWDHLIWWLYAGAIFTIGWAFLHG
jgi:uncharacterized membrane protein YhhN